MVIFADVVVHCIQGALSDCFGSIPVGSSVVAKLVEFYSDNMVVVEVLQSGTSRDVNLMVLLHHLSMFVVRHSFAFTACHMAGTFEFRG